MRNSTSLIGFTVAFLALLSFANADNPPDAVPRLETIDEASFARYSEMLDSGFNGAATRLDAATRHYEAARRDRPEDPRVEYGFALVLLKNFQQGEALSHLRASIAADAAYLPAWQLQFRESLRDRDHDVLFSQLLTLADVVGVISEDPPAETIRQQVAEWLGRAVGYLEGPLGDYEVAEQTVRVSQLLRARLGEGLVPGFEAGREALSHRHQLLRSHQFAAVVIAETEREEELQDSQAAREDLDETREQLEMSREQWDAWVKEQVADIDSQLEALQRQIGQIREEQRDINSAMLQVRAEMQQILTLAEQAAAGQTLIRVNSIVLERQLISRQTELDQYLSEYNALERERLDILSGAEGLFGERETSIASYQQATGAAANRLRQIDRWDRKLEQDAEETERSDVENSRQVRNVRHRIQSWATYEPFDLNAEPDRLRAEYQIQTP